MHFNPEMLTWAKLVAENSWMAIGFLAFTVKQREWIKERDGGTCVAYQLGIPHQCNGNPDMVKADRKLECHHILPQRYAKELGFDPDYPENGVTLCANFHRDYIHPDMGQAIKNYHRDKNSIAKVQRDRDKLLKQRVVYWNPKFDRILSVSAVRSTQRRIKERVWPSKKE